MQRMPYRPEEQISQTFNDGVVAVCAVTDTALPGYKPERRLTEKVKLRFAKRRLGIERYYSGKQNQVEINRIVRTPKHEAVNTQDIAIINGVQYQINLVQDTVGLYPPSMDITLVKISQTYRIKDDESDTEGDESNDMA